MILDDRTLSKKLKRLAKVSSEAAVLMAEVADHSVEKYGFEPSDLDNDLYLDACTGTGGVCAGMTAKEFHESMVEALAEKNN